MLLTEPATVLGVIDLGDVPASVPVPLLIIQMMRPDSRACSTDEIETWEALEDCYCQAYVSGDGASQIEAALDVMGATSAYLALPERFVECVTRRAAGGRLVVRLVPDRAGKEWQPPLWMRCPAFAVEVARG